MQMDLSERNTWEKETQFMLLAVLTSVQLVFSPECLGIKHNQTFSSLDILPQHDWVQARTNASTHANARTHQRTHEKITLRYTSFNVTKTVRDFGIASKQSHPLYCRRLYAFKRINITRENICWSFRVPHPMCLHSWWSKLVQRSPLYNKSFPAKNRKAKNS